jgi:hypothetical protein
MGWEQVWEQVSKWEQKRPLNLINENCYDFSPHLMIAPCQRAMRSTGELFVHR